jgi:hypothetical protein
MGLSYAGLEVFGNYKYNVRSSHDMPVQARRGGGGIAPTYSQPSTRKRWVVSTTPRPLYPQERPGTRTGGWVVLETCLEGVGYLTPPGFDSWTAQPMASCYTGYAILATTSIMCPGNTAHIYVAM